jgi:hypothetical protein
LRISTLRIRLLPRNIMTRSGFEHGYDLSIGLCRRYFRSGLVFVSFCQSYDVKHRHIWSPQELKNCSPHDFSIFLVCSQHGSACSQIHLRLCFSWLRAWHSLAMLGMHFSGFSWT